MLCVVVVLFLVARMAIPTSEQDRWLDLFFLVLAYGVIWGWVEANRASLARSDQERVARGSRIIRIILLPPPEASTHALNGGSPHGVEAPSTYSTDD